MIGILFLSFFHSNQAEASCKATVHIKTAWRTAVTLRDMYYGCSNSAAMSVVDFKNTSMDSAFEMTSNVTLDSLFDCQVICKEYRFTVHYSAGDGKKHYKEANRQIGGGTSDSFKIKLDSDDPTY